MNQSQPPENNLDDSDRRAAGHENTPSQQIEIQEPGNKGPGNTGPGNSEPVTAEPGEPTADENLLGSETRVDELRQELEESNNRWLRTEAELDNFRKRSKRELDDLRKFGCSSLMTDLLTVADNLNRAIESATGSDDQTGIVEGVKMVALQLTATLEQHGCQAIETVGSEFDPNKHEAVIMEPSADHPPQTVIREMRRGYQLHQRIIRPSQVVVAAPPAENAAN